MIPTSEYDKIVIEALRSMELTYISYGHGPILVSRNSLVRKIGVNETDHNIVLQLIAESIGREGNIVVNWISRTDNYLGIQVYEVNQETVGK